MIALVSAKGSPGVTVSALALALSWPGRCLLAECDPAGGDVLAGYLGGALDARRGLAELAVAELRERLREEFERQLVDLDAPRRERLLLPGLRDPAQSATVSPVWHAIADHLRATRKDGYAVIVDCGRLSVPHFGWPLLSAADLVLLVVRGTLPSVSHAVPAVATLRRMLHQTHPSPTVLSQIGVGQDVIAGGAADKIGLLVVDSGPYAADDVARRLQVRLVARLPHDPASARALSFGGAIHRRRPLLRAATTAGPPLAQALQEVADAV